MFCPKCGTQIGDSQFCPNCGYGAAPQQSGQPSGAKFDWKTLLEQKNIESLVAVAGVLPLVLIIVGGIIGVFTGIPFIGFIFKVIKVILTIVVILAELGACAGVGYLIMKDYSLRAPSGYLAAGTALVSLVTVIIITASGGFNAVAFVLSLITLVLAADIVSRVLLQNAGLASDIDISRDAGIYAAFIAQARDQSKQQKAQQEQILAQMQSSNAANVSCFDGKGSELLGYMLLSALLTTVTFSIATPWVTCMIVKWRKTHTVINGRRLTFTGTGGQLLGLYIKWVLLSLVTLGIYAFFAYVDYFKWEARHTFFADENPGPGAENPVGIFDGNTAEFFGYTILSELLTSFTLGIGFPWACTMFFKWQMGHYVVSGYRMSFDGNGLQFLGNWIICILLCLVTFGIYTPWAVVRINKWTYSHTKVAVPLTYGQPNYGQPNYIQY